MKHILMMPLLDEGADTWRPVEAEPEGVAFRIIGRVPDFEIWAFQPGALVICEERTFSDGETGLVPVHLAARN